MAERRRYTARQRANAVGIATVEGVTAAERQTGIPKTTIDYWLDKPEFVHLRTTARDALAERFWVGIQVGLEEVAKGLRGDAPLRDKAAALGTLYDRHALLTGGATGRTESRDITGSLADSDVIDALRAADQATAGVGAPAEDTKPAEG